MKRNIGIALTLTLLLSAPLFANPNPQEIKLYPVDEASQDRSFKIFRDRLVLALKRRDRKFVLSILDKRIQNSFGGSGGVKEFIEQWNLNSRNSKLWTELLKILSMGGSFVEDEGQKVFEAPYVSSRWDTIETKLPQDADAFNYAIALRKDVRIHSQPDVNAPTVGVLSYDVVEIDYQGEDDPWIKVKTLSGQDGYVSRDQIRSPVDYRAWFKKIRGRWVLYSLVAGD